MGETRFLWGVERSVPSRFPSSPLLLTAACLGDGRNVPEGRPFGRCTAGGSAPEAHVLGHLPLRSTRNLDKNSSISLDHHLACLFPVLAFLPILLPLPEHRTPASGHVHILSLCGAPKLQKVLFLLSQNCTSSSLDLSRIMGRSCAACPPRCPEVSFWILNP